MIAGVSAAHRYQSETPMARVGQNDKDAARFSVHKWKYDWPVLMSPSKVMKARYRVHRTQELLSKYCNWRSMRELTGLEPFTSVLVIEKILLIAEAVSSGLEEHNYPHAAWEAEGSHRLLGEAALYPSESATTLLEPGHEPRNFLQTTFEPPDHPPGPKA
jgi:hypothetical protein